MLFHHFDDLPPEIANVPPTRYSSDPTAAPLQHTVLYVEDHPVNVLLMQALFAKRPQHRLRVATTGEAGLRAALEDPPDLLLLDLRLPDCHGAELLRRLRAEPALAAVPAVAVTAEDTCDRTLAGFAEVWHKPMDLHAALLRLDRMLERPPGDHAAPADASRAPAWARPAGAGRHPPPAPIPFPAA